MKPLFLNVDLELMSRRKLDPLVEELGERVAVLHMGIPPDGRKGHFVSMEYWGPRFLSRRSPDLIIHAFCSLMEKLSPASKRLWKSARKVFDVGYELRKEEGFIQFTLRPDTVKRVASVGATIAVTCYRHQD